MARNPRFMDVDDAERVVNGDILVFPAGEGRLRMQPSTLSSWMSVGETLRADNNVDTVKRMITDASGTQTFIVCDVSERCECRDAGMFGNGVADPGPSVGRCREANIVPISLAALGDARLPGPVPGHAARNAVLRALPDAVADVVLPVLRRDVCPVWVHSSKLWRIASEDGRVDLDNVPEAYPGCVDDVHGETPRLSEALSASEAESFARSLVKQGVSYLLRSERLRVSGSFFQAMVRRGARLYRPNNDAARIIAKIVVGHSLCTALEEYRKIADAVSTHLSVLRIESGSLRRAAAWSVSASRRATLTAGEVAEIRKLSTEDTNV